MQALTSRGMPCMVWLWLSSMDIHGGAGREWTKTCHPRSVLALEYVTLFILISDLYMPFAITLPHTTVCPVVGLAL